MKHLNYQETQLVNGGKFIFSGRGGATPYGSYWAIPYGSYWAIPYGSYGNITGGYSFNVTQNISVSPTININQNFCEKPKINDAGNS